MTGDQFTSPGVYNKAIKAQEGITVKKNLTEMVFILDKSGSMAGLEADTIGGFNAMIKAAETRTRRSPGVDSAFCQQQHGHPRSG